MEAKDVQILLKALEKATGVSDHDEIRRKINEQEIGGLISRMESRSYNLEDNQKYFLMSYRDEMKSHSGNAQKIQLIKENYSDIENVYDTVESEINTALSETVELEKISKALSDKKLLKKAKKDESEIKQLKKKLDHLLKMKKRMEDFEKELEAETEHYDNVQHALSQRIALIEKLLSESGGGTGKTEKNATDGVVLKKGMELKSSTSGYTLVIDTEPGSAMMSAVNSVLDSSMSEKDRAEAACHQVNNIIDTPSSDSDNSDRISRQKRGDGKIYLSDVWSDGEGVCKEIAATLHLVYQKLGIHSRYMRGTYSGDRHAWVKVRAEKDVYLADSTHDTFQDYASATSHSEGENIVMIPDTYI